MISKEVQVLTFSIVSFIYISIPIIIGIIKYNQLDNYTALNVTSISTKEIIKSEITKITTSSSSSSMSSSSSSSSTTTTTSLGPPIWIELDMNFKCEGEAKDLTNCEVYFKRDITIEEIYKILVKFADFHYKKVILVHLNVISDILDKNENWETTTVFNDKDMAIFISQIHLNKFAIVINLINKKFTFINPPAKGKTIMNYYKEHISTYFKTIQRSMRFTYADFQMPDSYKSDKLKGLYVLAFTEYFSTNNPQLPAEFNINSYNQLIKYRFKRNGWKLEEL